MKRECEKDYYSVLGVSPDATPEEVRDAYISRTRVIHPDRFDPKQQPQDWKKANEMLAELNEAYAALRNGAHRAQYDDLRRGKQQRPAQQTANKPQQSEPASPSAFESGELTPGQVAFGNLPNNVQARLLKRQQNKGEQQFQVKLASVLWNFGYIAVLLCWYWYLFSDAKGAKWTGQTLMWYAGITLAVGTLIGQNCVTIKRWMKASLKPYFYVTPIYFIKTDFDIVTFRPIWTLKDVAATHNYKNGSYRGSDVVLKFEGYSENLSLSSKQQVETMLARMRSFDIRLKTAYANREHQYFLSNDDFLHVPRTGVPTTDLMSKGLRWLIYGSAVSGCAIGLFAANAVNNDLASKRWVSHTSPTEHIPFEQLPVKRATPRANPFIKRAGNQVFAEKEFVDSGDLFDEYQKADKSRSARKSVAATSYPEFAMPYSGSVQTYTSDRRIAPFEIKAALGSNYLLKLVDAFSGDPVLNVFVRSGTTVEVKAPLGKFEVRYASGDTWYGYDYLFGPETVYSKADKTFTFEAIGDEISGYTITLYRVANGNLSTSKIRPQEF